MNAACDELSRVEVGMRNVEWGSRDAACDELSRVEVGRRNHARLHEYQSTDIVNWLNS
jgi:hypothetical protein